MRTLKEERHEAIALLQAGRTVKAVSEQLQRSPQWVRKWRRRFAKSGYAGLKEEPRTPRRCSRALPQRVKEAVIRARMQLEAEASERQGLKYIGGQAVRTRLQTQGCDPLPSVPTIERMLRSAGVTHAPQVRIKPSLTYPRLQPQQAHELIQVDIVPHYLQGGERVACFNALDVVSRYPTGLAFTQRRAAEAVVFLCHVWQTLGIPHYTQVDNEGCFSGGATHPYVLGQVVRLALAVGTELVFSPPYYPESNGFIERFHQEYNRHVWDDTYLADLDTVNRQASHFFAHYRESGHQAALHGATPTSRHHERHPTYLSDADPLPTGRSVLTAGAVHFIRRVSAERTITVLNVAWLVPVDPDTGVWATLALAPEAAWLRIYDAAPDVPNRRCLCVHPFPLPEVGQPPAPLHPATVAQTPTVQPAQSAPTPLARSPIQPAQDASWLAAFPFLNFYAWLPWLVTSTPTHETIS